MGESWDVYISYATRDKAVVHQLAERLQKDGLRVWFDDWEIRPGDNIPAKIEEGLEGSRVLLLCMSAAAFGSEWARLEIVTYRFRDPMNKDRRFIPIRLDDAVVPGTLASFKYIDWRPDRRDVMYPALLKASRLGGTPQAERPSLPSASSSAPYRAPTPPSVKPSPTIPRFKLSAIAALTVSLTAGVWLLHRMYAGGSGPLPPRPSLVNLPGGTYDAPVISSPVFQAIANPLEIRNWDFLLRRHRLQEDTPGFALLDHEVTNREYAEFLGHVSKHGHAQCGGHPDSYVDHRPVYDKVNPSPLTGPDFPVTGLSWWDAYAFAHWRSARLPTQSEWERAFRDGSTGDLVSALADVSEDNFQTLCPSGRPPGRGSVLAEAFASTLYRTRTGIAGLCGNVAEYGLRTRRTGPTVDVDDAVALGGHIDTPGRTSALPFYYQRINSPEEKRLYGGGIRLAWDRIPQGHRGAVWFPPARGVWLGPDDETHPLVAVARSYSVFASYFSDVANQYLHQSAVTIRPFSVMRNEVTNREYAVFVEHMRKTHDHSRCIADEPNAFAADEHAPGNPSELAALPDHPVRKVAYYDAVAYCRWLGMDLPTAEQFQAAVRGKSGRLYPWGDTFEAGRCNENQNKEFSTTAPVDDPRLAGCSTPEGIMNLVGNVREWTRTANKDGQYILMGGAYGDDCALMGIGFIRSWAASPASEVGAGGFRCVADPPIRPAGADAHSR